MRSRSRRRIALEVLEPRLVLSTIVWNSSGSPTGGDWDIGSNWINGVVPGAQDTAIIQGLSGAGTVVLQSNLADSVASVVTDSTTTLEITNGSLSLGASASSTLGGPVNIDEGASLQVGSNTALTLGAGQTVKVDGTLALGTGDSVSFPTAQFATTQIVVNGLLKATGDQFSNSGNAGQSQTQIYVNAGGEVKATNSTFGIDEIHLASGSVVNSGDLSNNVFNTTLTVPALDLVWLESNKSFEDVDILPDTLAGPDTLTLQPMGTVSTAGMRFVFPGGFIVGSGATLNIEGASVVIRDAEQLLVSGTLFLDGGSTIAVEDLDDGGDSGGITVDGSIIVSNAAFTRLGGQNGDETTFFQIDSGASVSISGLTLALDQFLVDSGANPVVMEYCDFSGMGANSVIASGAAGSHINLTYNYWGTGIATLIDAKIVDQKDNANLPTIDYQPFQNATITTAQPSEVPFSPTDQTVTLSASVMTTVGDSVDGGHVTFTVFNGMQVVGNPTSPALVSSGLASADFTLPGGTAVGQYTIEASYVGDSLFLNSIDTSQLLTVSPEPTSW